MTTKIASLIAGNGQGFGIVRVAPELKIMPVKVYDSLGFGDGQIVQSGIHWAVNDVTPVTSVLPVRLVILVVHFHARLVHVGLSVDPTPVGSYARVGGKKFSSAVSGVQFYPVIG